MDSAKLTPRCCNKKQGTTGLLGDKRAKPRGWFAKKELVGQNQEVGLRKREMVGKNGGGGLRE